MPVCIVPEIIDVEACILEFPKESCFVFGHNLRVEESPYQESEDYQSSWSNIHRIRGHLHYYKTEVLCRYPQKIGPECSSHTSGMFAPTFRITVDSKEKLFRRAHTVEVLQCLGYEETYMSRGATVKFIDLMPSMDVMWIVYCDIMDFILFPNVMQPSVELLSQKADCYTVEVAKAENGSRPAKPMLATALPSLLDWKQSSAADHNIQLCLLALEDNATPVKSPAFLNSRYKTLLMDDSLEGDSGVLFYTIFPKKQAMLRLVRVLVVPVTLHSVIFAAYHASALNVHASFKAFFWKLRL
jgi:hypothetical protein